MGLEEPWFYPWPGICLPLLLTPLLTGPQEKVEGTFSLTQQTMSLSDSGDTLNISVNGFSGSEQYTQKLFLGFTFQVKVAAKVRGEEMLWKMAQSEECLA